MSLGKYHKTALRCRLLWQSNHPVAIVLTCASPARTAYNTALSLSAFCAECLIAHSPYHRLYAYRRVRIRKTVYMLPIHLCQSAVKPVCAGSA